jgi:hypothetical protein
MIRHDPMMMSGPRGGNDPQIRRGPNSASLYDVLDLILDKGIVIDAFVRVSLVGIELLTVDLRVVIASVDTYLRYAEGVERLGVYDRARATKLKDMVKDGAKGKAIEEGAETVGRALDDDDDEEDGKGNGKHKSGGVTGMLARGVKSTLGKVVDTITGDDDDEDEGGDEGDEAQGKRKGDEDDEQREERSRSKSRGREHSGNGGGRARAGGRR